MVGNIREIVEETIILICFILVAGIIFRLSVEEIIVGLMILICLIPVVKKWVEESISPMRKQRRG
jgi:uncharacterized membrane protein